MIYRAGLAMKEQQQRIIAIEILANKFETLLIEEGHSSKKKNLRHARTLEI